MVKKNILSILFLISALCMFNGCDIEDEDDYYDLEYLLLNRPWTEKFIDKNNFDVYHEVIFRSNHTGLDTYKTYTGYTLIKEEKIAFDWEWDPDFPNSIYIDYVDGTYSYFDRLWIRNDCLYGIWDDVDVEFIGKW